MQRDVTNNTMEGQDDDNNNEMNPSMEEENNNLESNENVEMENNEATNDQVDQDEGIEVVASEDVPVVSEEQTDATITGDAVAADDSEIQQEIENDIPVTEEVPDPSVEAEESNTNDFGASEENTMSEDPKANEDYNLSYEVDQIEGEAMNGVSEDAPQEYVTEPEPEVNVQGETVVEQELEPEAQPEPEPEQLQEQESEAQPEPEPEEVQEEEPVAHPEPQPEEIQEQEPEALPEPEPEAIQEQEPEAQPEPEPEEVQEQEPEAQPEPEPEEVQEQEPEAQPEPEPEEIQEQEPEAQPEPEPEEVQEQEPEAQPEPEPEEVQELEPEAQPEPEIQPEPEPQVNILSQDDDDDIQAQDEQTNDNVVEDSVDDQIEITKTDKFDESQAEADAEGDELFAPNEENDLEAEETVNIESMEMMTSLPPKISSSSSIRSTSSLSMVSRTQITTDADGSKSVKVGLKQRAKETQESKETKYEETAWDMYDNVDDVNELWKSAETPANDWTRMADHEVDDMRFESSMVAEIESVQDLDNKPAKKKPVPKPMFNDTDLFESSGYENLDSEPLREMLADRDREIDELKDKLLRAVRGDSEVIANLDTHGELDPRDSKIVHMAKQNRNLTLALNKEKSKNRELAQNVETLQADLAKSEAKKKIAADRRQATDSSVAELAAIKTKYEELQAKYESSRRQLETSQAESKLLKRCLQREVGDSPELDALISSGGADGTQDNWRGRAEKIALLQTKLKRALGQVDELRKQGDSDANDSIDDEEVMRPPASASVRTSGIAARAQGDIRQIEHERRQAMEKIADEYEELQEQLFDSKRIVTATKARVKVLEGENKRFKEQMAMLLNKSKNDDTLIEAMKGELDRVKRAASKYRERMAYLEHDTTSASAYEELRHHASTQGAEIEKLNQFVNRLKMENEHLKKTASAEISQIAQEQVDMQAISVDAKLLRVENERLGELIELFKRKLEEALLDREQAMSQCVKLERAKVELERQLGNIRQAGRKRPPQADEVSTLRDKYAVLVEEFRSFQYQAKTKLSQKDEEIRILREMGADIKKAYEIAIADMKRQIHSTTSDAHTRINRSVAYQPENEFGMSFSDDNDFRRKEYFDMPKPMMRQPQQQQHMMKPSPRRLSPVRTHAATASPKYLNTNILR